MSCTRTWEVEAARDGRLGAPELASHARHLLDCADCRKEQRELRRLREGLAALGDGDLDERRMRRNRAALLERAMAERAQGVASEPPRARYRRPLLALLVAAALALVSWLGVRTHDSLQQGVEVAGEASYRRYERDGRPMLELRSGRLLLKVTRKPGEPALRVLTPDGEIEDVGTTFAVEVQAGRTELVEVFVGQVRVSMAGKPTKLIDAAQRYRPYAPGPLPTLVLRSEPASSPALTDPPPPAAPEGVQRSLARGATARLDAHSSPARARSAAKSAPKSNHTPGADESSPSGLVFAEAVRALDGGLAVEAARLFKTFALRFPDDRRAEDAGYLRVVSWLRAGRTAEAHSAAAEFLRRYPHGFRRADVELLLER